MIKMLRKGDVVVLTADDGTQTEIEIDKELGVARHFEAKDRMGNKIHLFAGIDGNYWTVEISE